MRKINYLIVLLLTMASMPVLAATLDQVRKRGELVCGVSQGLPGFSSPDSEGRWVGIDADYCRAVAVAVLGSTEKVRFVPLSAKERFTALQSGEIDLLSRNTTWSLVRDTALGLDFVGVLFYDGQGFMVRKKSKVQSVRDLSGATVCTNLGTTTELNVADYFRSHGMKYKLVAYEKHDEVVAAYEAGRCDAFTTDVSGLYASRIKLKEPEAHLILPEMISKEPLSPVVRQGDSQWADITRWTLYALLEAEELGITSANVEQMRNESPSPGVRRFLGKEGDLGKDLGLSGDWAYKLIKTMGNYGELFEKNLGSGSPLKIARGRNALWNQGGLHYPMPFR